MSDDEPEGGYKNDSEDFEPDVLDDILDNSSTDNARNEVEVVSNTVKDRNDTPMEENQYNHDPERQFYLRYSRKNGKTTVRKFVKPSVLNCEICSMMFRSREGCDLEGNNTCGSTSTGFKFKGWPKGCDTPITNGFFYHADIEHYNICRKCNCKEEYSEEIDWFLCVQIREHRKIEDLKLEEVKRMELIQPSEYTIRTTPRKVQFVPNKKIQFVPNKKMELIQPLKLDISNETNNNILTVDLIHPLKEDSINSNDKNKIMEMIQPFSVTKVTRTNSNKVSTKGVPNKIHPLEVNNNSTKNESINVSEKVKPNLTGEQQHSETVARKPRRQPKKTDRKAAGATVDKCLGSSSQMKVFARANTEKTTKEVVGQIPDPHNRGTSSRGFYRLVPTPISVEVGESVNVRSLDFFPHHVVYEPVVQQPIDNNLDTLVVRMGLKPSLPSGSSTSTEGLCSEFVKACTL